MPKRRFPTTRTIGLILVALLGVTALAATIIQAAYPNTRLPLQVNIGGVSYSKLPKTEAGRPS
ncbi:hypothetical protein KGQ71_04385 [Patescibacteria group bacterium]|nr:hypothetical protein [Patescibacteria group bacterium]